MHILNIDNKMITDIYNLKKTLLKYLRSDYFNQTLMFLSSNLDYDKRFVHHQDLLVIQLMIGLFRLIHHLR